MLYCQKSQGRASLFVSLSFNLTFSVSFARTISFMYGLPASYWTAVEDLFGESRPMCCAGAPVYRIMARLLNKMGVLRGEGKRGRNKLETTHINSIAFVACSAALSLRLHFRRIFIMCSSVLFWSSSFQYLFNIGKGKGIFTTCTQNKNNNRRLSSSFNDQRQKKTTNKYYNVDERDSRRNERSKSYRLA